MVKLKKTSEGNISPQTSASTIGEMLRSARESKGLSLEDVHKKTKMHPATIDALEKGHIDSKLGETYTRAFLKNYAAFLGMDAGTIMGYVSKKHSSETKREEARRRDFSGKKKPAPEKDNAELIRAVVTIIVLVTALVILTFGAVKIGQYAKSIFLKIKSKPAAYKKAEPVKAAAKSAEKAAPAAAAAPAAEIIPIPKQKVLTLTLDTTNDVWLKVIVDGKVVFHKTLSKQSKETWKAEKEIKLSEIGKPEALAINVNGKQIDFSGKRLTRNILITHEGVNFEPK